MPKEHSPIKKPTKGRRWYQIENTVVFFDLVGFSKRSTSKKMARLFVEIQQIISELFEDDYYWGEIAHDLNTLVLLPTGDGYGICFPTSIDDKSVLDYVRRMWVAFSERKLNDSPVKARIGINRGINFVVEDVNEMPNIIGWGITMAHRVMSLGSAGHILCTSEFSAPLARDIPELVKIPGKYRIKHGDNLTVYNYFKKGVFGNPRKLRP